ncbi:MAG: hypothetical protein G8345_01555 [Magnetococcales bacterium]|nr:hypothetical protein [Magnetococcales bacterium]NGZ25556.1 hypothetical protein [Magnetococcales bacterium]
MTLKELKALKEEFEKDGRQAMAVYLTSEQAKELRWEIHQLYGFDPGEMLTTLYGMSVAAIDAPTFRFEE